MFLREVSSILALSSSIFTIGGFVVKVNKFEHNQIVPDHVTNQLKLHLSFSSYRKLNLRTGSNFQYLVNEEPKNRRVSQVQQRNYGVEVIFNNSSESRPKPQPELIKYYLESKPFWVNLFN